MKRLFLALAVAGMLSLFAAPVMAGGYYNRGHHHRYHDHSRHHYYQHHRPHHYYHHRPHYYRHRGPHYYHHRGPYHYGYPRYGATYRSPGISFSFGF